MLTAEIILILEFVISSKTIIYNNIRDMTDV